LSQGNQGYAFITTPPSIYPRLLHEDYFKGGVFRTFVNEYTVTALTTEEHTKRKLCDMIDILIYSTIVIILLLIYFKET
jgi:hypothetical protein